MLDKIPDPRECIFFQLSKASQAGIRFWGQKTAHHKVTPIQGLALMFLLFEDGVASRCLGERIQLDSATLTGILDRLEGLGLIERRPNPADRRAILVNLTPRGREIAGGLAGVAEEANREFLKSLSKEEELALRGLLKRIVK